MSIEAAIFDCDGTLLDSINMWESIQVFLMEKVDGELSEDDLRHITRSTIEEIGEFFHTQHAVGKSGPDVVRMIDRIAIKHFTHEARPCAGALELVKGLYDLGIPMAVASASPQRFLDLGLASTGFAPYFQEILSVEVVGQSKRSPAIFTYAADCLGADPRVCCGVEDSVYALHTLRDAGFQTLAVYSSPSSGSIEELSRVADRTVASLADIDAREFLAV